MDQIEIHDRIEKIFLDKPKSEDIKEAKVLMSENFDSKNYFFSQANEVWLDWLWLNGFLDNIKKKSEDPSQSSYRMPELYYLIKMAEKDSDKVVEIILSVPISEQTFNPEVVDQFLRICGDLPAIKLGEIIPKIYKENWIKLMKDFNHLGIDFKRMAKILIDGKDFSNALLLAESVLSLKPKKELVASSKQIGFDNPFYLYDLGDTDIFEYLVAVDDQWVEEAFRIVIQTVVQIVLLGDKSPNGELFDRQDAYYLSDVDFFAPKIHKSHTTDRETIRELVETASILAERLIKVSNTDSIKLSNIWKNYILLLPDSQLTWRFKLYFLSLASEAYKEIMKDALSRLFNAPHYYEIVSGTEYEKLLQTSFSVLSDEEKNDYGRKVIEYFSHPREKKEDDKKWWNVRGSRILSIVASQLTEDVKKLALKSGFKLDLEVEPRPSISSFTGGFVKDESPITQEELSSLPVEKIFEKLQGEWAPEIINEKYKNDDFLNRRNAEGLGNQLKIDISSRLQDYIDNASLFFEVDKVNSHYTYSFLLGVKEASNNKKVASKINWKGLFNLFDKIIKQGESTKFDQKKEKPSAGHSWLAGWNAVHSAMVDVVKELISDDNDKMIINFTEYRDAILEILRYLLSYPNPIQEEEKFKNTTSTKSPNDSQAYVSDPFSIAINSVRGRAFESFILFIYQDGKKFNKEDAVKISPDVKKMYEETLYKEKTRSIMFLFGRNIPSLYYRDIKWIKSLLPSIFPADPAKVSFYSASWEGYLSNSLYVEIFFDPDFQKLYERGIKLKEPKDLNQKHFVELDEGIATHFALAYLYFKEFTFDHLLFKFFLKNTTVKQLSKFVSFIGRTISGDEKLLKELIEKEPNIHEKLMIFWDWLLENKSGKEIFNEFGTWINLDRNLFEPIELTEHIRKTLENTNGVLSWELGLSKCIVQFANKAPQEAMKIARLYLYDGLVGNDHRNMYLHIDDDWINAFKILYHNTSTRDDAYTLINDLILEGGSVFWNLKNVTDEK